MTQPLVNHRLVFRVRSFHKLLSFYSFAKVYTHKCETMQMQQEGEGGEKENEEMNLSFKSRLLDKEK